MDGGRERVLTLLFKIFFLFFYFMIKNRIQARGYDTEVNAKQERR